MTVTTAAPAVAPTSTAVPRPARAANAVARTLQVLLGLFFALASALPKLIALPAAVVVFDAIGAGHWFMYLTGALELAGGVALLFRRWAAPAAVALIALLVGALITQITVMHGENVATPPVLMVPLAVIAWIRRADARALLATLRASLRAK